MKLEKFLTVKILPIFVIFLLIMIYSLSIVGNVSACFIFCNTPSPGPVNVSVSTSPNGLHTSAYAVVGGYTALASDYNNDGDLNDWNELIVTGPGGSGSGNSGNYNQTPQFIDRKPLGDVVTYNCSQFSGWVCDVDFPENSVTLKLFVDDEYVDTFSTSRQAPELVNWPWTRRFGTCGKSKNALWGYTYPTPASLKDGVTHKIVLRAINQGYYGDEYNVNLPTAWSQNGIAYSLNCPIPNVAKVDLGVSLNDISDQFGGSTFSISSTTVTNYSGVDINEPIPVSLQIVKKVGNNLNSWDFKGDGVGGDLILKTTIASGLIGGKKIKVQFNDINLPIGEYRVRAMVDRNGTIEKATSSSYFSNNISQWKFFTVKEAPPAKGQFESVSANNCTLTGWAYDPANTNVPINVDVYQGGASGSGGTKVMTCNADISRPDVISSDITNKNHGFVCSLPDSYKDGRSRNYYIHSMDIDGTPNNIINGTPKNLTCTSLPAKLLLCPDPLPQLVEKQTTQLRAKYWGTVAGTPDCNDPGSTDVTDDSSWSSSDTSNVTVSNTGSVTAVSWGSSNITVAYRGLSDRASLTVDPLPPEITLKADNNLVRYGDTGKLELSIKAQYKIICSIDGGDETNPTVTHVGNNSNEMTYIIDTLPLTSKKTVTVNCDVRELGLENMPSIENTEIIEVVPKAQES